MDVRIVPLAGGGCRVTQFVLHSPEPTVVEHEGVVKVITERKLKIEEGDEVVCLVIGTARPLGDGSEVEVVDARFVEVVEIKRRRG